MARKYFGTDGIRGTANKGAVNPGTVMRLALAAGEVFRRGNHRHRVVSVRYTPFGLYAGTGADGWIYGDGNGRYVGRPYADPSGCHVDPVLKGGCRSHDLGFTQPLPGQWHKALRSGRLQAF